MATPSFAATRGNATKNDKPKLNSSLAPVPYQLRLQDNPPHEFLLHSWWNLTAHVLRVKSKTKPGRLCRCEIKELEVYPEDGNVRLRIQFNEEKDRFVSDMVSPLSLILAQVYVCLRRAASEDDEDVASHPIMPVARRLPKLLCSNAADVFRGPSGAPWMRKLLATINEVNDHQLFLGQQPNVDDAFDFEALLQQPSLTTSSS